jgi:enterochelin esterase-like enzyme
VARAAVDRRGDEMNRQAASVAAVAILAAIVSVPIAEAQAGRGNTTPTPTVVSPELSETREITFRVYAPQAQAIRLSAGDIPGVGQNTQLTKGENGVWEVKLGPIDPGAYRYNFNIDGVSTIDPRNPTISESNNNVWSMVVVPGSDLYDTKDVPRGAVAEVTYFSTALGRFRRMHVYTPPGYEIGRDRYPVFYLLHGAGDNDDAWPSVGRAGFILDNLIAAKKARPMVVVMPAGHTQRTGTATGRTGTEEFVNDFNKDVMPYVEKHYRVLTDRANTAIAGLSMGGNHTLQVAIPRLERFAYIGVYSSALFGAFPELAGRGNRGAPPAPAPGTTPPPPLPTAAEWEKLHAAKLGDANLKKGLRLFWFATGKDDFLLAQTVATVDLFKKHGFSPIYKETTGGHTWINWRIYLAEFLPMLFQPGGARPTL